VRGQEVQLTEFTGRVSKSQKQGLFVRGQEVQLTEFTGRVSKSTKVETDAKWCFTTTLPTACTLPVPNTGSKVKTFSLSVAHVPCSPPSDDSGMEKQTISPTVKLCCHETRHIAIRPKFLINVKYKKQLGIWRSIITMIPVSIYELELSWLLCMMD
jgi:hypothetical protein